MKIEIQYIKEAKRIIDNYNAAISELGIFETTLAENKRLLLDMKSSIEKLKQSNDTDLLKKQKVFDVMSGYDKEIDRLQDVMLPYVTKLETLKKDSNILYGILKEKYPGATDKQLQEHIFEQLEEMKKTLS